MAITVLIRPRRNYPSCADPQRNLRIVITTRSLIRHDVEAEVVEAVDGAGEGRRVVEVTADVRFYAIPPNFDASRVGSGVVGVSCERHLSSRLVSCWEEINTVVNSKATPCDSFDRTKLHEQFAITMYWYDQFTSNVECTGIV